MGGGPWIHGAGMYELKLRADCVGGGSGGDTGGGGGGGGAW